MIAMLGSALAEPSAVIGSTTPSLKSGYRNVEFDNGFIGYDINHTLFSTAKGEEFIVKNTSAAESRLYPGEKIGEYLKILFAEYAHEILKASNMDLSQIIWTFSDYDYKNSSNDIVEHVIELAESGVSIPDYGMEPIPYDETQKVSFEFCVLDSVNPGPNNFFAFKVTYHPITAPEPDAGIPDTGDGAHLMLWASLVLLGGAALFLSRRRQYC